MENKKYACCIETVRPVRDALDVINGKWKLPIIISISVGDERFTDIQNIFQALRQRFSPKN